MYSSNKFADIRKLIFLDDNIIESSIRYVDLD